MSSVLTVRLLYPGELAGSEVGTAIPFSVAEGPRFISSAVSALASMISAETVN